MMKTFFASATFAAALATFTVVGCSSSSNNGNGNGTPGVDGGGNGSSSGGSSSGSGGVVTPGKDAGPVADAAPPPLPDGSVLPHGSQLVTGSTLSLVGVTSDDFAVYTDTSTKTAYAISLTAGSKPISLGTVVVSNNGTADVVVLGKVVFLGTTSTGGVGAASIWTSAATAPAPLATATYVRSGYAVSADGSHVAYLDSVDTTANTAALVVASSDGTGKSTLIPSADLGDVCFPIFGFVGANVVSAYCPVSGGVSVDAGAADGGTNVDVGVVTAFTSPAWTPVPLAASAQTVFSADPGGTKVAFNGLLGTQVVPVSGGTAVTIDALGEVGTETLSPGVFTNDGSHLIYTTTTQALELASTTAPAAPVQLAAAGSAADVLGLSADGKWVVTGNNIGNQGIDLGLSSASTAGTPVALTTGGSFGGDLFTADSSHVLFIDGNGALNAQAVTATTATSLGANAYADYATTGGKVVFNANYGSKGADLQSVDTTTTAAATLLVSQANPDFYVNSKKTTIVYTWSYDSSSSAGLWTLPAP